ncbi:hypothetical protein BK826_08070 [Rothia kristinae]|uniref:Uncharacterized protein n=1 Tax=Rothia kristinae TaxID=37923 RepID=A0A1S2MYN2_9MICC|nr:hypothetical protein [Rothia kristinae]OIJ35436.1 hypothetical protein BK826_08070 [Rothia kristinae]
MSANPELAVAAATAMAWPPILAVDPGSRSTGICLRIGTAALEAVTVERTGGDGHEHAAACRYAQQVIEAAREITRRNREALNREAVARGVQPGGLRHAAETLVTPTPRPVKGRQMGVAPRVLEHLPGAATVLGAVVGTWPRAILVPPRGGDHGGWDAVEGAPDNLRGRTPSGWLSGGSDRSHQRSAWAIAGAAHVLAAQPRSEQVRAASRAVASLSPSLDPESLIPALRAGLAQAGAWDLLDHLPALAAASVAVMTRGDRARADAARASVANFLEGSLA